MNISALLAAIEARQRLLSGSALENAARAVDEAKRRMQLDDVAEHLADLTREVPDLAARAADAIEQTHRQMQLDDDRITKLAAWVPELPDASVGAAALLAAEQTEQAMYDRIGQSLAAGLKADAMSREFADAVPTLMQDLHRAELAQFAVPSLPDLAVGLKALDFEPGVLELIRGSTLTNGIAASVQALQQMEIERRLALPDLDEVWREIDTVNARWSSAAEALAAAHAAGLNDDLHEQLSEFAARTKARASTPSSSSSDAGRVNETLTAESLAREADQIINAAKTDKERILTRALVLKVLWDIGVEYGPDIAQRVRVLIFALFVSVQPPQLPGSPKLFHQLEAQQSGSLIELPRAARPEDLLPTVIRQAGAKAQQRTLEFFTAEIRNRNTRRAYAYAVTVFFDWCEEQAIALDEIRPYTVAAYIEGLGHELAAPTVKQHLAAIRALFDYLVVGQVIPMNPAASVRGPKHSVKKGKTPVLNPDEARSLLDAIDTGTVIGHRDRALIGTMVYTFARVGAVLQMRVEDYFIQGRRGWVRLHEKGGKLHDVPCHHSLEKFLDEYIVAAGIASDADGMLFRTAAGRTGALTQNPLRQPDAYRMIQRRAEAAGIKTKIGNHTFRATGITAYLKNGGTLEIAQQLANHESPRSTKLYDGRQDEISLDEVERIVI